MNEIRKVQPMTPEELKHLVKSKGWLLKDVAERWGISQRQMSHIVQTTDRNIYYDDAIRGLESKQ